MNTTRTGEATMHGAVLYRLPGIGAITIGLCLSNTDDTTDELRMHAAFGRWEQGGTPALVDELPVLFGIPLRGCAVFDVDQAEEHLLTEPRLRTGEWLVVQRADRGPGWNPAPPGTRARAASIVAELVRDFREREDYRELLNHHRQSKAAQRARLCQERIERLQAQLTQLNLELATERHFLSRQQSHRCQA